jgi:hypothetical protein
MINSSLIVGSKNWNSQYRIVSEDLTCYRFINWKNVNTVRYGIECLIRGSQVLKIRMRMYDQARIGVDNRTLNFINIFVDKNKSVKFHNERI